VYIRVSLSCLLINYFRLGGRNFFRPKEYNLIFCRQENWCRVTTPTEFSTEDDNHLFTPQEASRILPDIKPRLKEIIERKRIADELKNEIEHYGLVGFETPELTQKNEELDAVVKDLMSRVSELEDLGVRVRDIDTGLIDFPANRFGNTVYLCWRYGESDIEFWHAENEGFSGRKMLNQQVISP
jgi:hypothetical protein